MLTKLSHREMLTHVEDLFGSPFEVDDSDAVLLVIRRHLQDSTEPDYRELLGRLVCVIDGTGVADHMPGSTVLAAAREALDWPARKAVAVLRGESP